MRTQPQKLPDKPENVSERNSQLEGARTAPSGAGKYEKASPSELRDQIAKKAYELYLARGRKDGHDLEDWLQAERLLLRQQHQKA